MKTAVRKKLWPHRGTTLTEMLVAITLLGISMIAIAGMLASSIRSLTDNLHQQRAARLSADLAELFGGMSTQVVISIEEAAQHDCGAEPCKPKAFIQAALYSWQRRVAETLPGGTGDYNVAHHEGTKALRVHLQWNSSNGDTGSHERLAPLSDPL